ncbi:homoserine kinase [Phyllobacterium sp. SYP-B3895]|uniref:homoserine kinase n=1 Tax=Phyllobacterium sp. SYP-B3895 TaxID=2663240 RepID=UPI0012996374|nr:homoserine kinase [Phyllobacterium sp. SYP-B3895]MRG56097.1 homoserine kinase [Phyllobacterium sp. SYP-B3895]
MAVYTDINEIDLARFLKDYEIGELLSYKGIAEGVENSNYLLHTSAGSFILTLYEKRVNSNDLPFFLGLMRHLAGKGISCPLPVNQKSGSSIGELAGRPAAIVTFLEGMWMRRPTVQHCFALGEALARMHIAGEDFPMRRKNALSVEGWRPLWENSRAGADGVEPGLASETEADLAFFEANWPSHLPHGVIHADLFPDNVFFLGNKLSGLIDFYFACTDLLAYDVAVCLNAWCFEKDNAFNLTKGTALLRGYNSIRPLSADEAANLPILARGSALRFMLTRLYDWLNTPEGSLVVKKDPMEYLRRMRFHRQIKSAQEYGLVLEGQRA